MNTNQRSSNQTIIALLREAEVQLMVINQETPSANFRYAIDMLELAIKTLQQH